jgi:hypothetical protein
VQLLELLRTLTTAANAAEVASALSTFESETDAAGWAWLGNKDNNRGPVEVSVDPGRSLVERLTNGIDAVLEAEYIRHDGLPVVRSPRDAAAAWLNVPQRGLSALSPA